MAIFRKKRNKESSMINYIELYRNGRIHLEDAYMDVCNILKRDNVNKGLDKADREGYIKQMHFLEGCIAIKYMKDKGYYLDTKIETKEWKKVPKK